MIALMIMRNIIDGVIFALMELDEKEQIENFNHKLVKGLRMPWGTPRNWIIFICIVFCGTLNEVGWKAAKLKCPGLGLPNNLWAKITTFWSPDVARRHRGRPRKRLRDELNKTNNQRSTLVLDRGIWESWGEVLAQ